MSDLPQIPWATNAKVVDVTSGPNGISSIKMTRHGVDAEVDVYGNVSLHKDSRENIKEHMTQSETLTRSLRKHLAENNSVLFIEDTKEWLEGPEVEALEKGPWDTAKPTVLDWWPSGKVKVRQRRGKPGRYRDGWSQHVFSEDWIGSQFKFVHFAFPDDEREALAIKWTNDSKPQVWFGDVDGFFALNEESFADSEAYSAYNQLFEDGLLWALDYMGVFEGRRISKRPYGDGFIDIEIPQWVGSVVMDNPDLLWPELAEKLMRQIGTLPDDLRKGLLTWVDLRRKEYEKLTGQQYLWGA